MPGFSLLEEQNSQPVLERLFYHYSTNYHQKGKEYLSKSARKIGKIGNLLGQIPYWGCVAAFKIQF